jgi:hypothetical protein
MREDVPTLEWSNNELSMPSVNWNVEEAKFQPRQ